MAPLLTSFCLSSLTHDLLRRVSTNVYNGDTVWNVSSESEPLSMRHSSSVYNGNTVWNVSSPSEPHLSHPAEGKSRTTSDPQVSNTHNGDTVHNVWSTPQPAPSRPTESISRTKSASHGSNIRVDPALGTAGGSLQLGTFQKQRTTFQTAESPDPRPTPRKRTPLENLTLFNATISCLVDAELEQFPEHMRHKLASDCECGRRRVGFWFPVRGKWDSGSDGDIVSHDVIKRAGLEGLVEAAEQSWTIGILGKSQVLTKTIALSWQLNNKEESFTQQFWVAEMEDGERAGFDFIVGGPWLNEHGYGIIETNESRKTTFFGLIRSLRLGGTRGRKLFAEKIIDHDLTLTQRKRSGKRKPKTRKREKS